jgi:hypothetical protein
VSTLREMAYQEYHRECCSAGEAEKPHRGDGVCDGERVPGVVVLPVSCRRALVDLSDDVATRVQAPLHLDAGRRPAESSE